MLLLDPGLCVSVDRLVTEIWGDEADARAVASLYTYVSSLRRLLGKARIARDPGGYRLVLRPGDQVDSVLFAATAAEARALARTDPASSLERFSAALGLWRGRPFEGLEDMPALAPEISRLEELQASVQADRFETILRAGDTPDAGEVDDLCRRRPYDERAWALLMRTLYRGGRQADALHAYRRMADLLGEELGIEPSPRLRRLEEQVLLQDPALDPAPIVTPSNLPAYLTTFVGRAGEQTLLIEALGSHRLVTVTGPGGVGKTRLAVEVAASLRPDYPDGIWWIDLAKVADEAGVGAAIAATVHAPGATVGSAATAAAALSGRRSLLVIDNCEHVLGAARRAAETILAAAPDLVILATSRVTLGLSGEHRIWLEGLPATSADGSPGEAMRLFAERARSIRPAPAADATQVAAVERICRRLDGMPLALELAAARTNVLSASEIADLLARRYAVLVDDGRDREIYRSLEATIGWSYGLLRPEEQASLAALGAFEGPFGIDAALAVLDLEDREAAVALLDRLVGASLVGVETRGDGSTRYRLLDTLRLYARDRLAESGNWNAVVNRHDRFCVELCRALADDLLVRGRHQALQLVADSADELVAAWDRMLADDPRAVLPIAWALGNHWQVRGGIAEGESRIGSLLVRTSDDRTHWRMFVLAVGAGLASRRGHMASALSWSDEAVALAETIGDPGTTVVALNFGAQLRIDCGDHGTALSMLHRSLAELGRAAQQGDPPQVVADGTSWALVSLAEAARWSGDPDARDQLYEVRRRFIDIGDPEGRSRADRVLVTISAIPLEERERLGREMVHLAASSAGDGALRLDAARAMAALGRESGDMDQAMAMCRVAVQSALAFGSLTDLGSALLHAGTVIGIQGNPRLAARLVGAGQQLCGSKPGPHRPPDLDAAIDDLRHALGDDRYRELDRIGAAMAPGEAAMLVLQALPSSAPDLAWRGVAGGVGHVPG